MMKKVVVIGVDGMDMDLLGRWSKDLTHLTALRGSTPDVSFRSIFPPDTTPAWATIYTGMNPAEHGIINFVNPADKKGGYEPLKWNDSLLQGNTFWDAVSGAGHAVCVVLPMLIFPGWKLNGSMLCRPVSPNSSSDPIRGFPNEIIKKYNPDSHVLNLIGGFVKKSRLSKLSKLLSDRLDEEARISLAMIKQENWQLYFTYFSALDEVQHVFWPYFDTEHPLYPGPTEFQSLIFDFYKRIDTIVGNLISICQQDDAIIVISDHGQGPRPTKVLNINEWLRCQGYLLGVNQSTAQTKQRLKSGIKKLLMKYIRKYGAGSVLMKISKMFPVWKSLLAPSAGINWQLTKAYASDLSAVKNYSYGGIRLNDQAKIANKDELINDIISELYKIKIPESDKPAVQWAARREDLYRGPHIDRYPEILVELAEQYGIGWDFSGNLFADEGDMHQLKPGTHRRSSAVLLTRNVEKNLLNDSVELMDIALLVKRLCNIECLEMEG